MFKIKGCTDPYRAISKFGMAIAFLTATASGGAASARGIAIDQIQPPAITACALGGACAANGFNGNYDYNFIGSDPGPPIDAFNLGVFNKIYVYADGVVSINKPLPAGASLAGGLGSLGSNYIAAGFADLGQSNPADFVVVGSVDPQFNADNTALFAEAVNVEWIFDMPGGETAILGLTLTDLSNEKPGEIGVFMDSGAGGVTWFGQNYPNAYCDALCQATVAQGDDFDAVFGVYLPNGALIGSGFKGFGAPVTVNSDFGYPGYTFNINVNSVPEPGSWALAISGFFLLGGQLRRARRARSAA